MLSVLSDIRVDPSLNKFVWSQGVKNIPKRLRVRISRKRNEDEEAKEKVSFCVPDKRFTIIHCDPLHFSLQLYCVVSHSPVDNFKGLQTETIA